MDTTEAQSAPAAVAESDDVHADVMAAFESLQQKEETGEPAPEESAERLRNERGQFAKAEGETPVQTNSDADPAAEKPTQPSEAVAPPSSWSADAKAEFAKLPSAVQAAVAKREAEINEGGVRWSEEKRRYEETIAPLRAAAQANGVDEREGLNRLLAADRFLKESPVEAIQWLAQAYGVNLQNMEQTQKRPQADPLVSQLHQKVSTLEQSLAERERQEVEATLAAFASAPGHEHFNDVKVTMGRLMASGEATTLDEAYERAVWALPSTRQKLLAAQTAVNAEDEKKARERATAEKARRAAVSVNGSPSLGSNPAVKRDYDTPEEAARAAWQTHMGSH